MSLEGPESIWEQLSRRSIEWAPCCGCGRPTATSDDEMDPLCQECYEDSERGDYYY